MLAFTCLHPKCEYWYKVLTIWVSPILTSDSQQQRRWKLIRHFLLFSSFQNTYFCHMKHKRISENIQQTRTKAWLHYQYTGRAEGLWRMHRHGPVVVQCTDSLVFPEQSLRQLGLHRISATTLNTQLTIICQPVIYHHYDCSTAVDLLVVLNAAEEISLRLTMQTACLLYCQHRFMLCSAYCVKHRQKYMNIYRKVPEGHIN